MRTTGYAIVRLTVVAAAVLLTLTFYRLALDSAGLSPAAPTAVRLVVALIACVFACFVLTSMILIATGISRAWRRGAVTVAQQVCATVYRELLRNTPVLEIVRSLPSELTEPELARVIQKWTRQYNSSTHISLRMLELIEHTSLPVGAEAVLNFQRMIRIRYLARYCKEDEHLLTRCMDTLERVESPMAAIYFGNPSLQKLRRDELIAMFQVPCLQRRAFALAIRQKLALGDDVIVLSSALFQASPPAAIFDELRNYFTSPQQIDDLLRRTFVKVICDGTPLIVAESINSYNPEIANAIGRHPAEREIIDQFFADLADSKSKKQQGLGNKPQSLDAFSTQ